MVRYCPSGKLSCEKLSGEKLSSEKLSVRNCRVGKCRSEKLSGEKLSWNRKFVASYVSNIYYARVCHSLMFTYTFVNHTNPHLSEWASQLF